MLERRPSDNVGGSYEKPLDYSIVEVPVPEVGDNEVLVGSGSPSVCDCSDGWIRSRSRHAVFAPQYVLSGSSSCVSDHL